MGKKAKKQLEEAKTLLARSMRINATALQELHRSPADAPHKPIATPVKRNWLPLGLVALAILVTGMFLGYQYYKGRAGDSDTGTVAALTDSSREHSSEKFEVIETWELPKELKEISGNVFIDAQHVACIQDNQGTIFIYNLASKKIDRTIPFGPTGDYEGIAKVDSKFYVLRADGMIIEVNTASPNTPEVKEFDLPLGIDHDTESLFYDQPNTRLLVVVKEKDPSGQNVKGIYAFDLKTMQMQKEPVVSVPGALPDDGNDQKKGKKKGNLLKPSDMIIHPETGELYILNGPSSQLVITDRTGAILSVTELDKKVFPQPEGLCFSPDGELYVSSEGAKNGTGVIAKVRIGR
jgi:uncharacterized protein YjiK